MNIADYTAFEIMKRGFIHALSNKEMGLKDYLSSVGVLLRAHTDSGEPEYGNEVRNVVASDYMLVNNGQTKAILLSGSTFIMGVSGLTIVDGLLMDVGNAFKYGDKMPQAQYRHLSNKPLTFNTFTGSYFVAKNT